jgi:hypothetical protein
MKKLLVLIFILGMFSVAIAQDVQVVQLNCKTDLIANPPEIELSPGDQLQFVAVSGEFAIFIENAGYFLEIDAADLQIHLDSSENPKSSIYRVRKRVTDMTITYTIYCISDDKWPDAPPRIIIKSSE